MKLHPHDDAISVIHHGRDRRGLLARVYATPTQRRAHGNCLLPGDEFVLSQRALSVMSAFKDNTMIRAASILRYVDVSKVDSPEFLFDFDELAQVCAYLRQLPAQLRPETAQWLRQRGVTDEQLDRFRDVSQLVDRRHRIVAGAEIHPALQAWIGQSTPTGVIWPWTVGPGAFLRLLSTVPKLKFGAMVPLLHVATNLDQRPASEVWLVEGLFDALALDRLGLTYATPSSGTWSELQLFTLCSLLKQYGCQTVVAAHDNDRVGLKESLFLWGVLRDRVGVKLFNYPAGTKDMAELVCRDGCDPRTLGFVEPETVAEKFLATEYQPLVDFDIYLGHRQEAYANDRYLWLDNTGNS